jgi:hypothetical protein
MKIKVLTRSKRLPEFLEKTAKFYAKELNIHKSKYTICIVTDKSIIEDGNNGLCAKTGDKEITIGLYSRLGVAKMMTTLAHEMVHAKQLARGQLKAEIKRGKAVHHWLGKKMNLDYLDRPWEREAFMRQSTLVENLIEYVSKKERAKKKFDK